MMHNAPLTNYNNEQLDVAYYNVVVCSVIRDNTDQDNNMQYDPIQYAVMQRNTLSCIPKNRSKILKHKATGQTAIHSKIIEGTMNNMLQ